LQSESGLLSNPWLSAFRQHVLGVLGFMKESQGASSIAWKGAGMSIVRDYRSTRTAVSLALFLSMALLALGARGAFGGTPLPGSSAGVAGFGNVHFDEQGNITVDIGQASAGVPVAGGGIDFKLPGPVVPGAVLILDPLDIGPNNPLGISDRLDFSSDPATGAGHMLYRSLIDDTETVLDPADVASFPTADVTVRAVELGPEGNNQFIYQTSGAIYYGMSDGSIPEPAGLGLLALGWLVLPRCRNRAAAPYGAPVL
jgi:hypothetical protein